MAKLKTIAVVVTSLSALSTTPLAHAATSNQIGMAMMRLNASLIDQGESNYASGSLWSNLRHSFRMAEVNTELVRRQEYRYSSNPAYFNRMVDRSKPYMYHIAAEVKRRNMPAEIALLPFVESAFVTKAKSHVGASGLWQFMPATGRHYGLEKTPLYDGRHDVYAATDAALNYLQYLYSLFGDWSLALAAYNWGEGNVARAITRAQAQGLDPVYENLRMPNETRNYVPKLLAVRNIINNPNAFGLNISPISNKPYFKAISIDQPIDEAEIVRLAGITQSEFQALNPAFNAPVFIPKYNRKLLLPASAVSTFERNYRKADPKSLLSWDIYTTYTSTSLSNIAAETGMSVSELKSINGIRSNNIGPGRSILVAKNSLGGNSGGSNMNFARVDSDNTPDTYSPNLNGFTGLPPRSPSAAELAAARPVQPKAPAITEERVAKEPAKPIAIAVSAPQVAQTTVVASKAEAMPQRITTESINSPTKVAAVETAKSASHPAQIATVAPITISTPAAPATTPIVTAQAATMPAPSSSVPTTEVASSDNDPLATLAEESSMRINATDRIQAALAQADAEEIAAQARAAKLAEARAKQQQRAEARLARANATNTVVATASPANASGTHRVTDGDTLFNISQRYNVSVSDLIMANNIKGNNIRKGQVLKIATTPKASSNTVRNVSYTVRPGDTLNAIANRFNVNVNDIRRWNNNTSNIKAGQRIKLIGS